ncbi:MAG: MHFG family PEP-CTERM protein [Burkholderiales bacterium]|nr:MHFG family PEP-CTERM protein [Burkholderiales bacterium]
MRSSCLWLLAAALMCGVFEPVFATPANPGPATLIQPSCAWNRPGHNPFMSDVVAAVDDYRDIPPEVRSRLKERMARHDYDDIVRIRRDSITGRGTYGATIRDMHFGTHQMCSSVTRAAWSERMQERGLVYCEGRQCILVPTVCRNVSRISRAAVEAEHVEAPDDPADKGTVAPAEVAATDPAPQPLSKPLAIEGPPSFAGPPGPLGEPVAPSAPPSGSYGGTFEAAPNFGPLPGALPTITSASVPPPGFDSPPPATPPVPEPQTWASLLGGLVALAAWCRRVNRRAAAPGSAR